MEKEKLKELLEETMKSDVQSVLSGENELVDLLGTCPDKIVKYLESLGVKCSDIKTNGWEWDFHIVCKLNGKKYILGGSGYYSDSIYFELEKE